MTVSLGVFLLLAAVYAVKHKGADLPGLLIGVAIGVIGADGWVGRVVNAVLASLEKVAADVNVF
jgi:hypothetical protein